MKLRSNTKTTATTTTLTNIYPPNQTKMPVRPRSSLSMTTDDKHRIVYTNKKRPNAVLTLAGFCIFLLILCVFLLGALIYVGKNLTEKKGATTLLNQSLNDFNDIFDNESNHIRLSTKPILSIRIDKNASSTTTSLPYLPMKPRRITPEMAASKFLQKLSFRLPRELKPLHYKLKLHPDLKNKTFAGNVAIKLDVKEPIAYIPIHSKLLTVKTDEVWQSNEKGEEVKKIEPSLTFDHADLEYWVTEFEKPLETGTYIIKLSFNGSLTNRIVGFYQSSYFDKSSNQSRMIATSKFEPTYARQAFPCFDEPAMKAQFQITVVRPKEGYHALSNMNIEKETIVGDNVEVEFALSVPMSTYLACFIVSDFAHQSATVKSAIQGATPFEMRVFSTAAQVNKVKYALDTGVAITEFYISYFNIHYPLPKLDMAAIPDFVSGAMEHWGLVTYRETALLYDPAISSSANKQRVATVVAHELAHMWFGNLVTMKWWNDLWLNEGFASYIEYKGVNEVHPEWKMLDQFIVDDLHGVMNFDATIASHPIVQTVESPNQITELFDSITYSKGASVIRMLENLVGEDKFRNATTEYLTRFYFQNAETEDFLNQIDSQEFAFDVKLIMETWTKQMGLPVVEVTRNENNVKLTQKRFFANPDDYNKTYNDSDFNYRWSIPITYFTSSDRTVRSLIFDYKDQQASFGVPVGDWVKINKNQVGYYRVNYPVDMWQSLISALKANTADFSISDRGHLINDAFALADASQLAYEVALDLSTYLEKELDYVPWRVASSHLREIRNLLYYTELFSDFTAYGRKIMNAVVEKVGFTVDANHLNNLLRANILSTACGFGHQASLTEAGTRFNTWLSNVDERPSPDIRSTVYYYGMQVNGNEEIWNKVWDLFVQEQDAQEKIKLMEALAAIKEPWILQRYINLAWDETYVRRQDYFSCLTYIANNRIGESLVWEYVRENWPRLVERFGINERTLGRLIPSITGRFATQTKLEEMETFFAKYPEAGAGTTARKQAIEKVKNNINWLAKNKDSVGLWLSKQTRSIAIN